MRICLITSYPPNRARLSEYGFSLVGELSNRRRISEICVLADRTDAEIRGCDKSNVRIMRMWKADDPLSILGIIPRIWKLRPDIVHFNMHFQSFGRSRLANSLGFMLVPICRLLGLRVVATVHNFGELVELEKVHVKPNLVNRIGIYAATKMLLSFATKVVVTVRLYLKYLERRYGCINATFIPHGTHNSGPISIDPHEKIVLMFGHMAPHKGLPLMLGVFDDFAKERRNIRLIVAGASHPNFPGYLESLMGYPRTNVDFVGYVPEEDIYKVFGIADVVVLPYLTTTGTSGVFHLACGYGKPIMASDLPEIREMISEGASALLFPPGGHEALKKTLLHLLANPKITKDMSIRNLDFAKGETWEIVAEDYERVYSHLLNK